MDVTYPKTEWLMYDRIQNLSDAQRSRYEAMIKLSDLINVAMRDDIIRTTGKYQEMLFTVFLDKLYETSVHINDCSNQIYMDDFVRIAYFSLPALKHIISFPSTQIEKNPEKIHASRMKQTSSATMQWLARKPGRSVSEKIAPQNKVLTKVTRFSADTKENRETMYLYGILRDLVQQRIKHSMCSTCAKSDECGKETKGLYELLALYSKIKHGELGSVPAIKQIYQNNKLMCDKYYKMVWDAVGQIPDMEDKLHNDWLNLEGRYFQIGFWLILAQILHNTETVIYDFKGSLHDENGFLWFGGDDAANRNDTSVELYWAERPEAPAILQQNGSVIEMIDSINQGILFSCDLSKVLPDTVG